MLSKPYSAPILLQEIIKWEKEFSSKVPDLETPTGLFLGLKGGEENYVCTPLDSLIFARTGMDGIHFCFLTDFGTIRSLEEAPIIRVSPMDFDYNVRLVARNIKDFFALNFFDSGLLLNEFGSEQRYIHYKRSEDEDQTTEYDLIWKHQTALAAKAAKEKFNLPTISNPYQYVQDIRSERLKHVVLRTKDSLGIAVPKPDLTRDYLNHPWVEHTISYTDLKQMTTFFRNAEKESKLALMRDYQFEWINDHPESLNLIVSELKKMGLEDAAKRLLQSMA